MHSMTHRFWLLKIVVATVLVLTSLGSCTNSGKSEDSLKFEELTCEYIVSPAGIETQSPRFGWKLVSLQNGEKQTAYRILVADSEEALKKANGNVWDSKKVESDESNNISFGGEELLPAKRYFWKTKVWNASNQEQEWSDIQHFETGLFSEKDWQGANWIGLSHDTRSSLLKSRPIQTRNMSVSRSETSHASPLFRKEVFIDQDIRAARVYITGLGYNELYVNGKRIGDAVLNPGQSSYDKRAFYDIYDISSMLQKGKNAMGVMLGNGFYGQNMAFGVKFLDYGEPALKCLIRIDYIEGGTEYIITDDSWKSTVGPVVFDNVYAGESYDARYEIPDWSQPDCNYTEWADAKIRNELDIPTLTAQLIPPVKKIKYMPAVEWYKTNSGKYIYDIGQNISGWAKIRVNEPAGTKITLRYSEILTPDKQDLEPNTTGVSATGFVQTDIYICKGGGEESWEPRFTYQGFRYIEVDGITNPDKNSVEACFVRTDVERTGTFTCSDDLLNQIYETSLWTIEGNLHSVPEDCPHREKCAWLGDAHTSVEVMNYNFDMRRFWKKFMDDVESNLGQGVQTYEGLPATPGIPTNIAVGRRVCQEARPDWGAAVIIVPWENYLFYNNKQILEDNYQHMVRWMEYVKNYLKDDILYQGYGDWCHPDWDGRTGVKTNVALTSTAYYYYSLQLMSEISRLLNKPKEAEEYLAEMSPVKTAFNKKFYDSELQTYGTQTANAMALETGLVPDGLEGAVAKSLAELELSQKKEGHFYTGIHGAKRMFNQLSKYAYEDALFTMLHKESFPSFQYLFDHGFTTWPEAFKNYDLSEEIIREGSHNHPMQSGFAMWFHRSVGGIQINELYPGFKHFIIKPFGFKHLRFAQADYQSIYGLISSEWKVENGVFTHEITIPVNSSASIFVPAKEESSVELIQHQKGNKENIQFLGAEKEFLKYKLESGKYEIRSILK